MTDPAQAPKIVLGVSGGIAAYKSAELVRLLMDRGYRVQAIMTASAQEFVHPLTFAALTGQRVITDLFAGSSGDATLQSAIEHIGVAQEADLLLVAPATANVLAKFANGVSDDFLTTMHLAYQGPIVVAPAMNTNMWDHPATRANLATLRGRGVRVVEPDSGALACGMVGPGRLADLDSIVAAVEEQLGRSRDLEGETVLITAGPTQEPIDPVRFLSNRSSGRMGFALAEEARSRGARVIIVCGPVSLDPPSACEVENVTTTDEMYNAVLRRLSEATIVIMAAAVSDYRPLKAESLKIKKASARKSLELEPTVDILAEVARLKGQRLLIGFAAETDQLLEHAEKKLQTKNCDLIVANPVGDSAAGAGFDSDENQGVLLSATGETIELPRSSKRRMAERIIDHALRLRPLLKPSRVKTG